jgi:hypothetical protein
VTGAAATAAPAAAARPGPFAPITPGPAFPAAPPTPPSPFSVTPPPVGGPTGSAVSAILELEKLRRAVEKLADDHTLRAATVELAARGLAAVPALLEAMERREAVLRKRAFEVLKFLAKEHAPFEYDPEANTEVRLRQVAYLRVRLERRR